VSVLQSILDGVALGAVYALVAVGLALVFGVMRLINFAHGELITAGGYTLALTAAFPRIASITITVLVCIALAVLMERLAFRPLRNASPATTLVATFAVAFALQGVWLIAFGPEGRTADVLATLNQRAIEGELDVRWITLAMLGAGGLLLGGTALLLGRTTIGLQMRAAAADFRAARLLGVRADTVISFAFVLAGLLAATVAILLTAQRPLVTPTFGLEVTILGLVGVVVGGIDRIGTATLGGFAIGFLTSVLGDALPAQERVFLPSFVFLLVILVLLLRPSGLFAPPGKSAVERV
jgi:branched-chain amino acid transport system permease protein